MAKLSPANPRSHAPRQLMSWAAFAELMHLSPVESRLVRNSPLLQRTSSGQVDPARARAVAEGIRQARREAGL
jgi:hypothetical protein